MTKEEKRQLRQEYIKAKKELKQEYRENKKILQTPKISLAQRFSIYLSKKMLNLCEKLEKQAKGLQNETKNSQLDKEETTFYTDIAMMKHPLLDSLKVDFSAVEKIINDLLENAKKEELKTKAETECNNK